MHTSIYVYIYISKFALPGMIARSEGGAGAGDRVRVHGRRCGAVHDDGSGRHHLFTQWKFASWQQLLRKVFQALVYINFGVCLRGKRSAEFFDKRVKVVCRTSARD